MNLRIKGFLVALSVALAPTCGFGEDSAVLERLPQYQPKTGVWGEIVIRGSDTLERLVEGWSHSFESLYPFVRFDLAASGSSAAPPALVSGEADLGAMSRRMKPSEKEKFIAAKSHRPTGIRVALDAVCLYVHQDNPLTGLTLEQVQKIFSGEVEKWSEVGVSGNALGAENIVTYGRAEGSGTRSFFESIALEKATLSEKMQAFNSNDLVVSKVQANAAGIGFAPMGYTLPGTRILKLGVREGEFYEPNARTAPSAAYPLVRFLFLYIDKKPGEPIPQTTEEFLRFILSKEGQRLVEESGQIPLSLQQGLKVLDHVIEHEPPPPSATK